MSKHHSNPKLIKQQQEIEAHRQQHYAYAKFLKETVLNKLCLIGFSGIGINKAFVTGIEADMVGAIAIQTSADNVPNTGEFFDIRNVTFYKVYNEEETTKLVSDYKSEKELKVVPSATNAPST